MPSSKAPPGHFTLLYFASAASYTKKDSEHLTAPLPLHRLFDVLEERYPGITERVLQSCAMTVNLEYVDVDLDDEGGGDVGKEGNEGGGAARGNETERYIKEGDEVAIIPPVSSG